MSTMITQTGKTLQELIAEEARRRVGEKYEGLCGDFVKEILSRYGHSIPPGKGGRLRHAGIEVPFDKRKEGDILLLYARKEDYKVNNPSTAGILMEEDKVVRVAWGTVVQATLNGRQGEIHYTFTRAANHMYEDYTNLERYHSFARVRRLEW